MQEIQPNEATIEQPINGAVASAPVADIEVVRWMLAAINLPWPRPEDKFFDVDMHAPAKVERIDALVQKSQISGAPPQVSLRITFLVCPDSPLVTQTFMVFRPNEAMNSPVDGPQPEYVGTTMSPIDGTPLGLWRIPRREAMPSPTPIRLSAARADQRAEQERAGNEQAPVAGEIEAKS